MRLENWQSPGFHDNVCFAKPLTTGPLHADSKESSRFLVLIPASPVTEALTKLKVLGLKRVCLLYLKYFFRGRHF